jgi:hypothetical protein
VETFRIKQKVSWKWANGTVEGEILEVFKERVEKTIKGAKIIRKGTPENPAYLVRSDKGNLALKLHSELSETSTKFAGSSLVNSLLGKD